MIHIVAVVLSSCFASTHHMPISLATFLKNGCNTKMYHHELSYNTIENDLKEKVLLRHFNYKDDDENNKCELVSIQNIPVCALIFRNEKNGIRVNNILINKGFLIMTNLGEEMRHDIMKKYKKVNMVTGCPNEDFYKNA